MSKVDATKLKNLRRSLHLSLKEMGRQLDVGASTYWRMEKDGNNCKATHLQKLAQIFDVNMDELLCQDETVVVSVVLEAKTKESLVALYEAVEKHAHTFIDSEMQLKRLEAAIKAVGRGGSSC